MFLLNIHIYTVIQEKQAVDRASNISAVRDAGQTEDFTDKPRRCQEWRSWWWRRMNDSLRASDGIASQRKNKRLQLPVHFRDVEEDITAFMDESRVRGWWWWWCWWWSVQTNIHICKKYHISPRENFINTADTKSVITQINEWYRKQKKSETYWGRQQGERFYLNNKSFN